MMPANSPPEALGIIYFDVQCYFALKNSSTVSPLFLMSPRSNPGANSLWSGIDIVDLDSWYKITWLPV